MNEITILKNELMALRKEFDSLKMSSAIPLTIDQALTERFTLNKNKIVALGTFTTAGGDASESITGLDALATDIAFAVLNTKGGTPRTLLTTAAVAGGINLEFSGDPSSDHAVSYLVIRP